MLSIEKLRVTILVTLVHLAPVRTPDPSSPIYSRPAINLYGIKSKM
jgi:hypothetical protein